MKKLIINTLTFLTAVGTFTSCNNQPAQSTDKTSTSMQMKTETVSYAAEGVTMNGYIAYDESSDKKRPGILVVPEWWGLTDYPKGRARQLAGLGYIALAVDMYGNGKTADNPDSASKMAMPFYQNPQMAKARFDAALATLKSFSQTDTANIAAIGYCFGGGQVLNMAKLGENLKGVVSFHGSLAGVPADKNLLKAKVLVCHGADDQFVKQDEVKRFKQQMDSIGADYSLKIFPGATHAFTNPEATALGKKFNMPIAYNAAADTASWKDMQEFFRTIFK
jgi:dienelactone hydrolase